MGYWEIIVPEATINYIENPSFEVNITDFWSFAQTGAGGSITQTGDQSCYGAYSAALLADDTLQSLFYSDNVNVADNAYVTATVRYYKATAFESRIYIYDATTPAVMATDTDNTATDGWETLELTAQNTTGGAINVSVYISNRAADNASIIYVDGVQLEVKAYATTYCDGTQKGCEWNGVEHNSTSTRSALSRAGGRVYDLDDDYGFEVTNYIDSGVAPLTQHLDEYAIIPGGEVSGYKVHPRVLTLTGLMHSLTGFSDLHDQIQGLIDLLKPDAVPNNQPVLLRYNAATVTKEIAVYYEAGMEGNYQARWCAQQNFAIRFLAADPFWYEIGESGAVLDTNDTTTLRYIGGRLRSTGQWDDLNVANNPAGGTTVSSILYGSDGLLYIAGWFTGWDNVANRDYVAYYNPQTDTWATWGALNDFDDFVYRILEGPDGTIYAVGQFSTGGGGTCDYIGYWDGANWATLGNPTAGTAAITAIYDACFDSTGNLIIVGNFTNLGGVANADYVGMWTGAAYAAVGGVATGGTGVVYSVTVDSNDNIYIGGTFANWNADINADSFAWWDGTTWASCGDIAVGGTVYCVAYDEQLGIVYLGGTFTNVGSDANADRVAGWTGTSFVSFGSGIADGAVRWLKIAPDGILYVATDNSTVAGGVSLVSSFARWNGSVWDNIDLDWGAIVGEAIEFGPVDPVVPENYDIFLGSRTTGAATFSGSTTITQQGSSVYPTIYLARSGGTSARAIQIRNETTGKELWLDYSLLDGEQLVIDTHALTATSSYFGNRPRAVMSGADFGEFALQPGTNQITAFVDVAGGPTVTAYMVWVDMFWSLD